MSWTCAVVMNGMGAHVKAIQTRMRHKDIQTTMNTYGHLLPSAFEGMGARMDAWLKEQQGRVQAVSTVN